MSSNKSMRSCISRIEGLRERRTSRYRDRRIPDHRGNRTRGHGRRVSCAAAFPGKVCGIEGPAVSPDARHRSIKRFQSEAKIIARFNHPNIVPDLFHWGGKRGLLHCHGLHTGPLAQQGTGTAQGFRAMSSRLQRCGRYFRTHPDFTRLNVDNKKNRRAASIGAARDASFWDRTYLTSFSPVRRGRGCAQLCPQEPRLPRGPQALQHHAFRRGCADNRGLRARQGHAVAYNRSVARLPRHRGLRLPGTYQRKRGE